MPDRPPRRYRQLLQDADNDPLGGLTNLFDVAMVFAAAILLALLSRAPLPGTLSRQEDVTALESVGKDGLEIVHSDTQRLKHYRTSEHQLRGMGERLGIAYRLESGEVVYVPSKQTAPQR